MKVSQVIKSALTAAALLQSSVMAAECATVDCSQRALTFAFTYGYPIYPYGLAVRGTDNATTNTLFHQRDLATAANTWLVRPNADTVYSRVFLDVSNNDLEITIPEFGDRYWIWPFYDFYGNNVANIGAINGNPAGKYLVTFNKDNWGVQTENVAAPYKAYINLPTAYALTLARILVEANSDDIDAVRKLQDGFGIEEIKRRPGRCKSSVVAPKLDLSIFSNPEYMPGEVNSIEQSVLKLTAKFAKYNPPIVPGDRAWIAQLLEQAGIQDGVFTQAAGTDLTEASRAANTSASALLSQPGFLINVGGN
ncbi:unnamed protein product [Parascedosporium putredinis]|uniref:DUF1254 domain-containing protein n=1 Tax=Parascedosporium putredinis TaxID=1442378 RepID=A0A9P1GZ82_9PEZI|nr:unnamed protein product [Parascedosporium putredinis]CAI7992586.1 unnamed protein product [Parascedosporium putredinis]